MAEIDVSLGELRDYLKGIHDTAKRKLYGASLADRPAATAVAVGTTFTIVDDARNYDSWISDGTNWLEV